MQEQVAAKLAFQRFKRKAIGKTVDYDGGQRKRGGRLAAPVCYLAASAVVVAATVVAAPDAVAAAATGEQKDQNDDPPAVITATIVTHKEYLQILFERLGHSFQCIPAGKKCAKGRRMVEMENGEWKMENCGVPSGRIENLRTVRRPVPTDGHNIPLSVYCVRIDGDLAVFFFVLLDALLDQMFNLAVHRPGILFCHYSDFIEQLRLQADSSLDFVCSHNNTSISF